jgi:Conserved protein implicated in secretion
LALLIGEREPIKAQLLEAVSSIKTIGAKIDASLSKLEERGKKLFEEAAEFYARGDSTRATIYANEVAVIRRISKKLSMCRLALEVVETRIETVIESGNIAAVLQPAIEVIRSIKDEVGPIIPQAEAELASLSAALSEIMSNSLQNEIKSIESMFKTESAEEILGEIKKAVVEKGVQELPMPPETQVAEREAESV